MSEIYRRVGDKLVRLDFSCRCLADLGEPGSELRRALDEAITARLQAWGIAGPKPPADAVSIAAGRLAWRHDSGLGSVLYFQDAATAAARCLLVFDAARRSQTRYKWDKRAAGGEAAMSGQPLVAMSNASGNFYLDGVGEVSLEQAAGLSEEQLNAVWPGGVIDPGTAAANCAAWENLGLDNFSALKCARNARLGETGGDIPNLQEGLRIYCSALALDALDPTAADNPDLTLASILSPERIYNNAKRIWLSTEASAGCMRGITCAGVCDAGFGKNDACFVIPVLEL